MAFGGTGGTQYAAFLRRYFGITDPEGATVPPELLQAFVLESDRPEYKYVLGVTLAGGAFDQTSTAVDAPQVILHNPQSSNQLVVLTRVWWQLRTLSNPINYKLYRGTDLTLSGFGFAGGPSGPLDTRDSRIVANGGTPTRIGSVAAVGSLVASIFDTVDAPVLNELVVDREPIVLGPGTGFLIEVGGVGIATLSGGFRWYERALREGER